MMVKMLATGSDQFNASFLYSSTPTTWLNGAARSFKHCVLFPPSQPKGIGMSDIPHLNWDLSSRFPQLSAESGLSLAHHNVGGDRGSPNMPTQQPAWSDGVQSDEAMIIRNLENDFHQISSTSVSTTLYQGQGIATTSNGFSNASLFIERTPSYPVIAGANTTTNQPSSSVLVSNDGTKHFLCDCGYQTTRKSDMTRHRESSKHVGRKHVCSFCGKRYTRRTNLGRHEKTHI